MPCAMQNEPSLGQSHRDAVVVFSEAGFGELEFQFGQDVGSHQNRVGIFSDLARHLQEYAMNLGLFFVEQADQFVVLLDGFERLDKDGLSAGTGSVHYALDTAFLLDLYRDHEALAADGDEFILHGAPFGQLAQVAAQRFLNLPFLLFDFAANAAQLGRSAIVKRAVGQDLVTERAQEAGEIQNASGECVDGAPVGAHGGGRLTHDFSPLGCAVGDEDNVADLGGFERGSRDAGFLDQLFYFRQAGEFEASADAAILANFRGELLLDSNPGMIERRHKLSDAALT